MALNFKQIFEGLRLKKKTTLTSDTKGELEVLDSDGKLYYHDGTTRTALLTTTSTEVITNKSLSDSTTAIVDVSDNTKQIKFDAAGTTGTSTTLLSSQTTNKTLTLPNATDTLVGKATTDTLTNKTIDANGIGNSISNLETADLASGVLNTSTSLSGASNTQVPSALAVKTYVDNGLAAQNQASEISFTPAGSISATDVQAAIEEVSGDIDGHIADTVDAHDASAISNIPAGNIAATDVQSALNELDSEKAKLAGDITQAFSVLRIAQGTSTDSTTTGSNASLSAFTSGIVRITDGSLVSLANIPAGSTGQQLELVNRTGVSVSIVDSSGAVGTAANRILTGTSANITLASDASLLLEYDSTTARWQVIGGSGGGSGVATSAVDNVFNINDSSDATKQINFDAGGTTGTKTTITAAQTANRVVTLPNATTTLVGTDVTQTLTNKTLSGNTATNLISGSGTLTLNTSGTVTLPNTTGTAITTGDTGTVTSTMILDGTILNADVNASAAIARSKTASGTAYRILANDVSGVMSENAAITASRAVASDTNGQLVAATTTSTELGYISGVTSALQTQLNTKIGINYINNYNAEVDTTGWATYADAAGTSPVNGTGGSPTTTWTRSTSSPLRGSGSFLLTKDAANRQGEGASYDFTIDSADQAKVLQISMDYIVSSGTFVAGTSSADSDVTVWIYDVTNSVLIQPNTIRLFSNSTTVSDKFSATFQTSSNSTSYRLIIHVGSASASAYTLKFDNILVNTFVPDSGIPTFDTVTTTGTITAVTTAPTKGTVGTDKMQYSRVGEKLFFNWTYSQTAAGSAGSGIYLITLPVSLVADVNKIFADVSLGTTVGSGVLSNQAAGIADISQHAEVYLYDSTHLAIKLLGQAAGTNTFSRWSDASGINFGSTNVKVNIFGSLPIQGWASSAQTSDQTDGRLVTAKAGGDAASASSGNPIIFPTSVYDTHSAYSTSTGRYTVPVSGYYRIHGYINSANTAVALTVYKNAAAESFGAGNTDSNGECAYTYTILASAGDLLDLRPGATLDATATSTIHFERLSGTNAITSTESVNMRYFSSSTSISSSLATIVYGTKDYDSHGQYSSGTYTVVTPGKFQVNAALLIAGTIALNNTLIIEIQKNGTVVSRETQFLPATLTDAKARISDSISCSAGDTLRIQVSTTATSPSIVSSNFDNYLSIYRAGN